MYYPEDYQFNLFLAVVTKRATQSSDEVELETASKVVKLMGEFEQVTKHMKCPVNEGNLISSFVQFLAPAQKRELKQYKRTLLQQKPKYLKMRKTKVISS